MNANDVVQIVKSGEAITFMVLVPFAWFQGLYGMCTGGTIMAKYGGLISRGWGLLRIMRLILNFELIVLGLYIFGWLEGSFMSPFTAENIGWCLVILVLNTLIPYMDKRRFRCEPALARRIARSERIYALSMLTRISLIFTIVSLGTMYVLTDTSEYYRGRDGRIYRVRDMYDL